MENSAFIIPADKTFLRFKMHDDPLPPGGMVQLVIEYNQLESLVFTSEKNGAVPDFVYLTIERVTMSKTKPDGSEEQLEFKPSGREKVIHIRNGRHYIPVIRGISLPPGEYKNPRVYLNPVARIVYEDVEYNSDLSKPHITYNGRFTVQHGKITTLYVVPAREYGRETSGNPASGFRAVLHPDHKSGRSGKRLHVQMNTVEAGATETVPIERVFIRFLKIEAVDISGNRILLNDKPSEFELLTLRNGAVALMGHNMVPAGEYQYFEMTIDRTNNRVEYDNDSAALVIEDRSNNVLRFMGPWESRGGRLTEIFLEFMANTSIYPSRKSPGTYILDPDIFTTSVISMTSEQDTRLRDALGKTSNMVVTQSEVIFQGRVDELVPTMGNDIRGVKAIYSDMQLAVEDRLRGAVTGRLPLRVIGGEFGGMKLRVAGMPEFSRNERFLIFLKKRNERYVPVLGAFGKVTLY